MNFRESELYLTLPFSPKKVGFDTRLRLDPIYPRDSEHEVNIYRAEYLVSPQDPTQVSSLSYTCKYVHFEPRQKRVATGARWEVYLRRKIDLFPKTSVYHTLFIWEKKTDARVTVLNT